MFDQLELQRVFALPLGCDFSTAFLEGLRARMLGRSPQDWAQVCIYVNTRRTARRLEALLSDSPAMILPDIRVIGDLSRDLSVPLAAAANPLVRHLHLADLVGAFLQKASDLAPRVMMFDLAQSLSGLLDELDSEGLSVDALQNVVPDHLSGHWQRSMDFLAILKDYLTALGDGMSGTEARQRAVVVHLAQQWLHEPPQGPVIVAGSTGSRGSTAMFMRAVAGLAQGAVVLPGFDFDMPAELWGQLGQEHPQYGFYSLSKALEFDPCAVENWHDTAPLNPARNALASLALRPAPVTAQWLAEAPKLLATLPEACGGLSLIEAPDPRAEASAIALCLRRALADGKKAALVTPDRVLTRRVSAEMLRWGILPDDSAGHPAPLTPPGMFLRMVAGFFGEPVTPLALIELLKHPLCAAGQGRGAHLGLTRRLEIKELRRGLVEVDFGEIAKTEDSAAWLEWLAVPFARLRDATPRVLADWVALHRETAQILSAGVAGDGAALWDKEAGKVALKVVEALGATGHSALYSAAEYRALFANTLQQEEVRDDPVLAHPDVAIWGTLEARVNSADLVIMAGLNDGVWPKVSRKDTWLNRDIRRQIGLQLPERQIGLSAHDFQQSFGAAQVVLSRAIRDGEAPTVASRWLMRLQNLLAGMGNVGVAELAAMRARGDRLIVGARLLDVPAQVLPAAPRPAPAPPVNIRPKRLSVTQIETLIRDPYAIYARHILNLRKLDPLTAKPDGRAKGNTFHTILEGFVDRTIDGLGNAPEAYDMVVNAVLAQSPWPATRRLWRAQLMRAKDWFIAAETDRRAVATPFKREVKGTRAVSPDFTLSAKADRIDMSADGAVSIYDYKSGNKATVKQVQEFAVQLPLEGAIALGAGFEGLNSTALGQLQLIYLGSGGGVITLNADDPVMVDVWSRLGEMVDRYAQPTTGYPARIRAELVSYAGDYDHLARRGEWQDEDPFETEVLA